jgi:hypothetical protein
MEHLDEADRAVDIVAQPVAVEPVDRERDADRPEGEQDAPEQRKPDRRPALPVQAELLHLFGFAAHAPVRRGMCRA